MTSDVVEAENCTSVQLCFCAVHRHTAALIVVDARLYTVTAALFSICQRSAKTNIGLFKITFFFTSLNGIDDASSPNDIK